jgi:pectin methylesterase-like acyl-CoA thioesterase
MPILCVALCGGAILAHSQSIFVKLSSSRTTTNSVNAINPPPGNSSSAAAPFSGNYWNVITQSNNCPPGITAPFDTNLYVNLPLRDSSNNVISATLTVGYHLAVDTGARIEPSSANGENSLQPGGVMQNAWRNFQTGNFSTWTFSNLTANGQYGLYIYGGTTTSGQSALVSNISGSAVIVVTSNVVANSAGVFGSIWTISGGATNLMPQGTSWNFVTGQADANGVFRFIHGFKSDGNFRYMNGFQLVPLSAPSLTGPTNQTIIAGNNGTLSASVTGFPTPALQWLENGTNVVGATNATLGLPNVQYSQDAFGYCLIASNEAGIATNCMTLTVIVTPGIANLTNQAAAVGTDITIAPNITGVPTPSLQWQKAGTNLTGETSSTLSLPNAQTGDSGEHCLIASNAAGIVTNCMTLTIGSDIVPIISGLTDQIVVQGNTGTFSASVSGVPLPALQWQENSVDIPGATGSSLVLTNVQYSQNGYAYSLVASNSAGVAVSNATLFVLVPVSITNQPQSLVVTNTQTASFSVGAVGVPAPTYQWQKNGNPIANATNDTYTVASAAPADMGTYAVVVSNSVNSVTSSNATLIVNSTMSPVSLTPSNTATGICYDTPLYITFDRTPQLRNAGKINIYNVSSTNPVDSLDMSLNQVAGPYASNFQARVIGGETFNTFPVIITGNTAAIYPRLGVLTSNQTYYVTVDNGVFTDTNGALFAGITDSNTWRFTTKPTGPANPLNMVVAADGSGDFCTVQGAVDSVPSGNTTSRLINIRDGSYVEIVNINSRHNLTFRGQSRAGTVVGYANNANLGPGGSTHSRMAFKVSANDTAIENLTVLNRTPRGGGQAEALMVETNTKRFICNNAEISSYQDTVLGNTPGTQMYFNNSLIQGDTDFIWGGMNAFFTNCEVRSRSGGASITQPRTDPISNGIAFVNCSITRSSNGVINTTFARALGYCTANVVYASCLIDSNVTGWTSSDVSSCGASLRWWEYNNRDLLTGSPVSYNGTALTNGDSRVELFSSATIWLYGWTPSLAPNILSGPTNLTVTPSQSAAFSVSATGIPSPSYQWLHAGTNLIGQTGATLSIASADAVYAGTYSVIVSNTAGSATNSATLFVTLTPFQSWQNQYFGCTLCSQAAGNADPDGDRLDNNAEFLAGTDPTSSASGLRIISTKTSGGDVVISWTTAGGHTNVVQVTAGNGSGAYSTNFEDLSGEIVVTGTGDQTTNYVDNGGATNEPARYYRVRLVP